MPIKTEVGIWLRDNGFTNLCFISYAHIGETEMTEFARRLQTGILDELKYQVDEPRVFLDQKHIPPGNIWPQDLRDNLSRSIAMVAVLSQVYFSPTHSWCGKEWAAMDRLGTARLPRQSAQPIIPILFRETPLPPAAQCIKHLNLSRNQITGRRYYTTREFKQAIRDIVGKIETIAELMFANRCRVLIDGFQWPDSSAFADYVAPAPVTPFRGRS